MWFVYYISRQSSENVSNPSTFESGDIFQTPCTTKIDLFSGIVSKILCLVFPAVVVSTIEAVDAAECRTTNSTTTKTFLFPRICHLGVNRFA